MNKDLLPIYKEDLEKAKEMLNYWYAQEASLQRYLEQAKKMIEHFEVKSEKLSNKVKELENA